MDTRFSVDVEEVDRIRALRVRGSVSGSEYAVASSRSLLEYQIQKCMLQLQGQEETYRRNLVKACADVLLMLDCHERFGSHVDAQAGPFRALREAMLDAGYKDYARWKSRNPFLDMGLGESRK